MAEQRPSGCGVSQDRVRWVANLHLLFTEAPLLQRPALARTEGFEEVELWWPFDGQPRPSSTQVDDLIGAITDAGVRLTAMNLYAGTMASGDRGVVSRPGQARDFTDSLAVASEVGARLGTRLFNVPYGRRTADLTSERQDEVALAGLSAAVDALEGVDGTILVEPLSGFPDYPIRSSREALDVVHAVRQGTGSARVGMLLDQYHLVANGEDPRADLDYAVPDVRHVQVADVPGRGEPGAGEADLPGFVDALMSQGYAGAVALEYTPTTTTTQSLATWRKTFGLAPPPLG